LLDEPRRRTSRQNLTNQTTAGSGEIAMSLAVVIASLVWTALLLAAAVAILGVERTVKGR
jgi:hypothetical protein